MIVAEVCCLLIMCIVIIFAAAEKNVIIIYLQRRSTPVKCAAEEKMAPVLHSSRLTALSFSFAKGNPALWASVTRR